MVAPAATRKSTAVDAAKTLLSTPVLAKVVGFGFAVGCGVGFFGVSVVGGTLGAGVSITVTSAV